MSRFNYIIAHQTKAIYQAALLSESQHILTSLIEEFPRYNTVEEKTCAYILYILTGADPSQNKQYLQWLVNQYIKRQFKTEDIFQVKEDLLQFESIKSRIEQKDINKYDYYELGELLQRIFGGGVELEIDTSDPELDVLYDGPLGLLVSPKTAAAACRAGSGTKWCTAATNNNQFTAYNKSGPLYIWKDKSGEKYQFHFETGQYMDAQDRPVDNELLQNWYKSHPVLSKFFKQHEAQLLVEPIATPALINWAKTIIQGRWIIAEELIATAGPEHVFTYVFDVIKGRWPEAEPYIMKDPWVAYKYAKHIIKSRWPEAEPYIVMSLNMGQAYASDFIKGRWPEYEHEIAEKLNNSLFISDNFKPPLVISAFIRYASSFLVNISYSTPDDQSLSNIETAICKHIILSTSPTYKERLLEHLYSYVKITRGIGAIDSSSTRKQLLDTCEQLLYRCYTTSNLPCSVDINAIIPKDFYYHTIRCGEYSND